MLCWIRIKFCGFHGKEIQGGDRLPVVGKEREPALGRIAPALAVSAAADVQPWEIACGLKINDIASTASMKGDEKRPVFNGLFRSVRQWSIWSRGFQMER